MNKEEFDVLARTHGVDVYGDVFSECGYGISFCFDICYALYVYNSFYNPVEDINNALYRHNFNCGSGFSETKFLTDDAGEYSIAQSIYYDIEQEKNHEFYISMLDWFFDNRGKNDD